MQRTASASAMDAPRVLGIGGGAAICQADVPRAVISLDFELRWGIHDTYGLDFEAQRASLERTHEVVPAVLRLLVAHDLHATWAAVGALGCTSWEDYFRRAPRPPRYAVPSFAIRPEYADRDPNGVLHFAPDLIASVASAPGQELATHTFSHLFLRERGVTAADCAADLEAVVKLYEERFQTLPRSLVFPRNQSAFLDVVRASTVRVWRGNQKPWYYDCEESERYGIVPRVLKLLEEVNPFCTRATPLEADMTRATLFLRLRLPDVLWRAHLERIRRELDSLSAGDVFHVWFHPENLGEETQTRLSRLEQVLELIAKHRDAGQLRSCTMADLVM